MDPPTRNPTGARLPGPTPSLHSANALRVPASTAQTTTVTSAHNGGTSNGTGTMDKPDVNSKKWNDHENVIFFKELGKSRDFAAIAQVVSTKTTSQVRDYYYRIQKKCVALFREGAEGEEPIWTLDTKNPTQMRNMLLCWHDMESKSKPSDPPPKGTLDPEAQRNYRKHKQKEARRKATALWKLIQQKEKKDRERQEKERLKKEAERLRRGEKMKQAKNRERDAALAASVRPGLDTATTRSGRKTSIKRGIGTAMPSLRRADSNDLSVTGSSDVSQSEGPPIDLSSLTGTKEELERLIARHMNNVKRSLTFLAQYVSSMNMRKLTDAVLQEAATSAMPAPPPTTSATALDGIPPPLGGVVTLGNTLGNSSGATAAVTSTPSGTSGAVVISSITGQTRVTLTFKPKSNGVLEACQSRGIGERFQLGFKASKPMKSIVTYLNQKFRPILPQNESVRIYPSPIDFPQHHGYGLDSGVLAVKDVFGQLGLDPLASIPFEYDWATRPTVTASLDMDTLPLASDVLAQYPLVSPLKSTAQAIRQRRGSHDSAPSSGQLAPLAPPPPGGVFDHFANDDISRDGFHHKPGEWHSGHSQIGGGDSSSRHGHAGPPQAHNIPHDDSVHPPLANAVNGPVDGGQGGPRWTAIASHKAGGSGSTGAVTTTTLASGTVGITSPLRGEKRKSAPTTPTRIAKRTQPPSLSQQSQGDSGPSVSESQGAMWDVDQMITHSLGGDEDLG